MGTNTLPSISFYDTAGQTLSSGMNLTATRIQTLSDYIELYNSSVPSNPVIVFAIGGGNTGKIYWGATGNGNYMWYNYGSSQFELVIGNSVKKTFP